MIFLQPLDLQGHTAPHLKDLINICLENESQGHDMTFNMIYLCWKYPYFISYKQTPLFWTEVGCTALTSSNAFFVTDITLRLSCYRYAISISKTLNASFGSWTSITLRLAFYAFASSISGTLIYRIMNWKSMSFKHDFNSLKINVSNDSCANIIFF